MEVNDIVSFDLNILWIKLVIVIVIALSIFLFMTKPFQTKKVQENTTLLDFTTYLNERISVLMKDYNIPGVNIALIQKGEIAWVKSYGYANLEKKRKMTNDTYCRVESISKSVTAWGIMNLVEQERIELDKPVKLYLKNWEFPDSKYSAENVTVRQLLSHSAGMPLGTIGQRYSPKEDLPSLKKVLSQNGVLQQKPGLSFSYSNTGFNLLELLIEEVTGRDFAEYMTKEVLTPLGMNHSSFTWNENFNPVVPHGYDLKGRSIPVYVYPDKASGGLFATIEDIAKFVAAGMPDYSNKNLKVLNDKSIKKLYKPIMEISGLYSLVYDSYGLGHFIERLPNGNKAVSHGGQGSGWMTQFYSVPETGDGIVILTNSQRSWPFFANILSDWAQWSGFSSTGMGLITRATKVLWGIIGFILILLLWKVWRLGTGFISNRRRFAPFARDNSLLRSVQFGLFTVLVLSLLWAINQDYLFITSVFPRMTVWLGYTIVFSAIVLFFLVLFPCVEEDEK